MLTGPQILMLVVIATLGHAMALFWYVARQRQWRICARTIYDLPIKDDQVRREIRNSLHTPMHAVILGIFLFFGFFANTRFVSFLYTAVVITIWAEIWHYSSHRAFHLRQLHWIHLEHHRSHLNSPFTAMSFSFTEKFIFDLGMLLPMALLDHFVSLNAYGIGGWYIGYLAINSFSHANFELKSSNFNRFFGKVLTSTTYHSLHHSRYTGNYGLGTRVLDRLFNTEWDDYEPLYDQICRENRPLKKLREKASGASI